EVDVDAAAAARHLGERRREAGGSAVLERDREVALDELEARLDQLPAGGRTAASAGRTLVCCVVTEHLAGAEACAADAVWPGPRPHRDHVAEDPADPGSRALERLDR